MVGERPNSMATLLGLWNGNREPQKSKRHNYREKELRCLKKDLGSLTLEAFEGVKGRDTLVAYLKLLQKRELSARTIRNRIGAVRSACADAVDRGWLKAMPGRIELPPLPAPETHWISEASAWAIAGQIYAREVERTKDEAKREIYLRHRDAFMLAYYSGQHIGDVLRMTADEILWLPKMFIRKNTKSSKVIRPEPFKMPGGMVRVLQSQLDRAGRPWREGESLCGIDLDSFEAEADADAMWPSWLDVVSTAAKKAQVRGKINQHILRHSCAAGLYLAGYGEEYAVRYLGHVDARMLHEIYLAVLPRLGTCEATLWSEDGANAAAKPAGADVVEFRPRGSGKGGAGRK